MLTQQVTVDEGTSFSSPIHHFLQAFSHNLLPVATASISKMGKTSKKLSSSLDTEVKRQNDLPVTDFPDQMLVSTEECETSWYFNEDDSNQDDLAFAIAPTHELFCQPPNSDWCCFTSLVNACDTLEEGRKLLGSKRKAETLSEEDFTHARRRLQGDLRVNIARNGISSGDAWQYLNEFSSELNITEWKFNRKKEMNLLKLLLPNKAKAGLSYIVLGSTSSDKKIRDKVKNLLIGRRKFGKKRGYKYEVSYKESMTHEMQKFAQEKMRTWKSRNGKLSNKGDRQPHAICIKFNNEGIPFRLDPGKLISFYFLISELIFLYSQEKKRPYACIMKLENSKLGAITLLP